MLGKSETIGSSAQLFSVKNKKLKFFSRKKNSSTQRNPDIITRITKVNLPIITNTITPKKTLISANGNLGNAFDKVLLSQYVPASVIINYDLEILQFKGQTAPFLQNSSGKASFNVLKMAHLDIVFELRNAIHNAIKTKQAVRKMGIEMSRDIEKNIAQLVNIEVAPIKVEGEEPLLIIVFMGQQIDLPEYPQFDAKNNSIAKDRRIKKLEEELMSARADMRSITNDQEAAYEELQSANEEIISSNEELQSLNEELETSKEEIEATNEELITSNQELHIRIQQIEELYTYYEGIISTVHEPVLILDKNIRIKSANKSFCKVFHVIEDEIIGISLYKLGNSQWNLPRLRELLEEIVPKANYSVQLEPMDSTAAPFIITQPEFMRRMKEMSQTGGGGMFGMGNFPEMYNLVVNTNSDLATTILNTSDKSAQESLVKQALDLAKISQGLLKGEELTAFVKRSFELIK
jgi:two-component system CheB/CheR fusion protein